MQRRFLASWRGVLLATAFASLIVASFSFVVAAPAPQATVASGDSSGGLGTVIGQETNPFRLKTFPRTNYEWPFATGPHYGGQDLENAPGVLRTRVGSFDLRGARQSDLPAELTAADRFADLGVQYYVLMLDPASFGDGSFDGLRQSIEANGGAIIKQIPVAGFIARMTPSALASVQASPAVIAAQPYHPAYKLDTHLGRAPLADPFKAVSNVYDLEVMVHAGENAGATAARLAEMGGNVLSVFGDTIPYQRFRTWQLAGRTVGLVGLGAVGRATKWRMEGLGLRVVATDPFADDATHSLDQLLAESHVVSMHAPASPDTFGMIAAAQFEAMTPGAFYLNTARAGLHDTDALIEALSTGKLGGAGLDHVEGEVLPRDHPLLGFDNVVLTPHIGGATYDVEVNQTAMMVDGITAILAGERPPNLANPEVYDR